ncbi:MAG: DUF1566 domain-containing protein [Methylococcaceae bacterium]
MMFNIKHIPLILTITLGMIFFLPATQAADRYTVSANGEEVKDNETQLIWRRCPAGMGGSGCTGSASTFTHQAALQHAAGQAASTGVAWRLPNVKELASLADLGRRNPAIDTAFFPNTPSNVFWSSSPNVGYTYNAWYVNFYYGYVNDYGVRNSAFPVRLVRASQ